MTETALSALTRAWATTMVAVLLLISGLAVAKGWDGATYYERLQETLNLDE